MSKNSKEEEKNNKKKGGSRVLPLELKEETKYMIYAIIFFVITLLFVLASFGGSGRVGRALHDLGTLIFGYGYFLLPTFKTYPTYRQPTISPNIFSTRRCQSAW
jgi:hypothetical protein